MVDVAVAGDRDVGLRQPAAVDDRRVVELVGHDEHAGSAEGGEHAEVGGEAGREQHGGLGALPGRQLGFELAVHWAVADDQPGRPRAGAPPLDGLDGGGRTAECWLSPR